MLWLLKKPITINQKEIVSDNTEQEKGMHNIFIHIILQIVKIVHFPLRRRGESSFKLEKLEKEGKNVI